MRAVNTIPKVEYILENLIYAFFATGIYRQLIFKCLPTVSYNYSKLALWLIVIICVITGMLLTLKRNRNYISLIVNIAIPFEIYTLAAYKTFAPAYFKIICIVSVIAGFSYFLLVLLFNANGKTPLHKRKIVIKKMQHGLFGARTIIACGLIFLCLPMSISSFFGGSLFFGSGSSKKSEETYTVRDHMEIMQNILPNRWAELSPDEKLQTLQCVADVEASHLGIPQLNVSVKNLGDASYKAEYDYRTYGVVVNINALDDPIEELVNSTCHESFHGYEWMLCRTFDSISDDECKNLIIFDSVEIYKSEFVSSIDPDEDYLGYYCQQSEVDAREHAENDTEQLYYLVNYYLSQATG